VVLAVHARPCAALTHLFGPPPLPIAVSLLLVHPQKIKNINNVNKQFPGTKCFHSGLNLGCQGRISFQWTTEALKYNISSFLALPIAPF
jgi:hypothetical protein